ncbi:MAG: hypothetical protein DWQ29_24600 [Planctomycetota bacterium]|nr:MAG: hypothetical protein DWQ29_24600 [Planctomycetota bacterium]
MSSGIEFETPENVEIRYQPGGVGHRFVAWLIDQILVILVSIFLFFAILIAGIFFGAILDQVMDRVSKLFRDSNTDPRAGQQLVMYAAGFIALLLGLGNMLYFMAAELFMRGQTVGKRMIEIRVVKANGFALDPVSILVRNIFRLIDNFAPLWIVPVLSKKGQRLGDMVAGTIVVADKPAPLCRVREELADRVAADAKFRFDHATLKRLRPFDFDTVEQVLDRWDDVPRPQLESLLDRLIDPLARRLKVDAPADSDRLAFLEDLMAAEYRRQSRSLA